MEHPEEQEEPPAPAPKRRGRPKKAREEGEVVHPVHHPGVVSVTPGGVTSNVTPDRGVMPNITPPQPLTTGLWMGLLTTQREMELETRRDKYKRFSLT